MAAISRRARDTRVIGSGPRKGAEFNVEVPTFISAVAEYAGGQDASLLFSWDSPLQRMGFLEITGTEATLAVPDPNQFDGDLKVRRADDREWTVIASSGAAAGRGSGVVDMVRAIRRGRAAPGLGRDGPARARDDDRDRPVRPDGGVRAGRVRLRAARGAGGGLGSVCRGRLASASGWSATRSWARAHSQAWRTVDRVFDLPLRPRLAAICGRDQAATAAAADRLGWAAAETDWRALIARDDVQLIDIAAPGGLHAPIAIAALQAGKHVLCEKPLANTLAEAELMAAAADAAFPSGARAMVGFNYRRVPALALARRLVEQGRIGTLRHVRAVYLQDWLVDPDSPLTWRMQAEQAGSGALGDLGAHIVDLARFLTGDEIAGVSAVSATFVEERPLLDGEGAGPGHGRRRGGVHRPVRRPARWARSRRPGTPPGARTGCGSSSTARRGSLAFDLERLNELEFYDGDDTDGGATGGFRRILVTEPEHPYLSGWWPPGHTLGWEHTFTNQARDLLTAIADGGQPTPSFGDGLAVQRVLDAVQRSAAAGSGWVRVDEARGASVRSR